MVIASIFIILVIFIIIKKANENKNENINKNEEIIVYTENIEDIQTTKIPYIRKNLMTKNEWYFYKQLKPIADKLNLTILCKTRLADLLEIEKGLNKSEWQIAFNKINKKHIDFLLCNPDNLYPILLIELDDNSHEKDKIKERDEFIEKVIDKTGYKLLRVRGTNDLEEKIRAKI